MYRGDKTCGNTTGIGGSSLENVSLYAALFASKRTSMVNRFLMSDKLGELFLTYVRNEIHSTHKPLVSAPHSARTSVEMNICFLGVRIYLACLYMCNQL